MDRGERGSGQADVIWRDFTCAPFPSDGRPPEAARTDLDGFRT